MTSNWKEFSNVVQALETEGREGNLEGALVFLNSDSSTVEQVMYKENSKLSNRVNYAKLEIGKNSFLMVFVEFGNTYRSKTKLRIAFFKATCEFDS